LIVENVKNFLTKYNLSNNFIVAFSGGYDSMCLLDILNKLNYKVVAVHLNHNWRGEESKAEADNCKNFCKSRNIKFYSEMLSENIPKTETCAREERYKFFEKCAKKFQSDIVFTAHNFEDNAETVLYRIIKGTGTAGLCGIAEQRGIFYRPLLKISRKEIEQYCIDNNLTPNKDSSNENTKYKRNLIRKKIIPLMQEINPEVIKAINSLSEIANEDIKSTNEQKYKIRALLKENNLEYDKATIEKIENFINRNKNSKSGKTLSLSNNLWLYTSSKKTELIKKTPKTNTEIFITQEGEYNFENLVFSIRSYNKTTKNFPEDNTYKALVHLDKINFSLRHRKNGDIITPLGCNGTQKLKKYLNEKKIPQHEKDTIVFLCRDNEILWACGIGINDKIKVKDKPTHIIELKGKQ